MPLDMQCCGPITAYGQKVKTVRLGIYTDAASAPEMSGVICGVLHVLRILGQPPVARDNYIDLGGVSYDEHVARTSRFLRQVSADKVPPFDPHRWASAGRRYVNHDGVALQYSMDDI